MKIVVQTLSLTLLAASVSGQVCVEQTFDCNEPVPGILKLANASCACNNSAHSGALRYADGKAFVCSGSSKWKPVQFQEIVVDYGTVENPGSSCKDIQDKAGQQPSDGVFWIRLRGKKDVFTFCLELTMSR